MKSIIIGTAGHVDHGKTTLIKALTGTDTDRLKEEQERGMTIDIGFASLRLPNGQQVSIIDVPGHERFIKNMLAGAGGIDAALLVIAADESVMPQTIEHIEILSLLEIKRGVVALTKSDMVDEEWLRLAIQDVKQALSSTFLADAPIIPVSGMTGIGLPELLGAIQDMVSGIEQRDTSGPFRLPIDRVFTLTGFGTVVTGTLAAGIVRVGDAVEILPKGLKSHIRQLQVHGKKVDSAQAGTRVAMNLVGLEVDDLTRGDICATPGTLLASSYFDLRLDLLPDAAKPLKNRARIRFYTGTSELLGRISLLDRDELAPGEGCYAQFKSETEAVGARRDRFVIRSYSPMTTIGGGMIIDPAAKRHRRFDTAAIARLETSSRGTPEELFEQTLKLAPFGMTQAEISRSPDAANLRLMIDSLMRDGRIEDLDQGRILHVSTVNSYTSRIADALNRFHARNPLKPGMSKEELRTSALKELDNKSFTILLDFLVGRGTIASSDSLVSVKDFNPALSTAQQKAADMITGALKQSGVNVPSMCELTEGMGQPQGVMKDLIDLLAHRGEIIKVAEDMFFHASTIRDIEQILTDHLAAHGTVTVSQFRDLTSSSRKYAMPILEYFDSRKLTRRVGDERTLIVPR